MMMASKPPTSLSAVPSRAPSESIIRTTKALFDAKRDSSFSAKLLKHGMVHDKSMHACDREKKKEMDIFEKSKSALSLSCNQFDEVAEQVRQIQANLAMRQKQMALIATEKYSALCIQTAVRVMFAKTKVLKIRKGRFIVAWYMMKFLFRRRLRLRRLLQRNIRNFILRRRGQGILKLVRDVKQFQVHLNGILEVERQFIKREIKKFEAHLVKHWFVFGVAKATKAILYSELDPSAAALVHNEPLNRMVRLYKRYKRLRFLRGNFGKLVYCAFSQASETEDEVMRTPLPTGFGEQYTGGNIFSYIKTRVEALQLAQPVSRSGTPRRAASKKSPVASAARSVGSPVTGPGPKHIHVSPKATMTVESSASVPIVYPVPNVGFYKITSLRGLVEFIEDLQSVALSAPQLVDNKVPLALYNSAINSNIICNSILSPARMSRRPSNGSGGYIPAMLGSPRDDPRKQSHARPRYPDKCFPTYCPPVGPFYMDEEAIAAAVALIYPDGYTPYKEPGKKKRPTRAGKPSETMAKAAQVAVAESGKSPVPPTDKNKPSKGGGVANTRTVK